MNRLPIELHHMIASYLIPPVYHLAEGLQDHICWEGLCLNPHPGMVPLIDAYFERCLTIQSHLEWTMLLRLHSNPTAFPLVEKYGYFFLVLLSRRYHNLPPIEVGTPSQELMHAIENGTIRMTLSYHPQAEAVYAYPGIFKLDTVKTKAALDQWVAEHVDKKLKQ